VTDFATFFFCNEKESVNTYWIFGYLKDCEGYYRLGLMPCSFVVIRNSLSGEWSPTGSTRHGGYWLPIENLVEWNWQGKPKYSEKTRPSAALSTKKSTWRDPGSNPVRRGGKLATNRLSYGAALVIRIFGVTFWSLKEMVAESFQLWFLYSDLASGRVKRWEVTAMWFLRRWLLAPEKRLRKRVYPLFLVKGWEV
jgi:hypothetical protein